MLIYCLVCFPLFVGVLSLSCCALLCVHYSFAIILKNKWKLAALLCVVTKSVLWCFHRVQWIDLQYAIVVFPDHTHFFVACDQQRHRPACTSLLFGPRCEKTCLQAIVNNKGTDQPVHRRSLISTCVIFFLERIICRLATSKISFL